MDVTIYFVGTDRDDAVSGLPFDSEESAESYREDYPSDHLNVYYATVYIDAIDLTCTS